ncbi:hypothetical protein QQS21_001214 [Conoideocrella luteorostrata]|uniref:Uncharacterized protein n=1 Tax=Conoideocrella luteorostrata TaxID=1105319 RepID=A0AAJ0FYH7_9HYPO|nr:hypothetical protein QQS21_001214 [Conoideocrella luteorostrata]
MATDSERRQWFLHTSYPVNFPSHEALTLTRSEYDSFLVEEFARRHEDTPVCTQAAPGVEAAESETSKSDTFTMLGSLTVNELGGEVDHINVASTASGTEPVGEQQDVDAALVQDDAPDMENKMFTENMDITYRTTTNPLVDLFCELEDTISGPCLRDALEAAWRADPLTTLKIIFNSRSIHLGKASRLIFYKAAGWLAQNHPLTLLANLQWLSRPVIEKKVQEHGEEDLVIVEPQQDTDERVAFDVRYGVSHGYWKDLLNLLALAANNKLDVLSDPADVLNVEDSVIRNSIMAKRRGTKYKGARGRNRGRTLSDPSDRDEEQKTVYNYGHNKEMAKKVQNQIRDDRHKAAVDNFNSNTICRTLHITVARLFAEQLQSDLKAMRSSDPKVHKTISLCGKWAPSHANFHDKHTFVTSSIAEILYPQRSFANEQVRTMDRETYLRYAREEYRKDMSALRKYLEVVERDVTAGTFKNIKYDRVPSQAMSRYTKLFAQKDFTRFEKYIDRVAEGRANISGATLLPSTLVKKAIQTGIMASMPDEEGIEEWLKTNSAGELSRLKILQIENKVIDAQWNTLVKRIKNSGTLSSCIAVCDVSGSMSGPALRDGTTPIHSAIGLSLLIAEATASPFAGSFITFSGTPEIKTIDLSQSLAEKYYNMQTSDWGMNTNFVAVFRDLLLPLARKHKLKPEDMIKRVLVFSDMQFDAAESSYSNSRSADSKWSSSYERISALFRAEGYVMPELVFWNLAGGNRGDSTAPKPVTASDEGTCLVSGYSQGMLKVFMENGTFEDEEDEEDEELDQGVQDESGSDDEVLVTNPEVQETRRKKAKMDPLSVVRKAVGHKAYDMLKVLD